MGNIVAGWGMLIVETIAKVRRAYFIHQKPIKAICREFRLSRRVVRIWRRYSNSVFQGIPD
jgi:hypothetical protein